jgi:thiol-disulfide isomerase/thioredoxin
MTKGKENNKYISVLMFIGQHCSYCGPMMQILTELMKAGELSQLEIVNIEKDPQRAAELSVRSVPWLQIGPFELPGARTKKELQLWIKRASSDEGMKEYLEEVLSEGNIASAKKLVSRDARALVAVIRLMADPEAKINIRLGVGVLIEDMAESDMFATVTPLLIDYLSDTDPRIRGDACHYLSLTKNKDFIPQIEKLLSDESAEVREIAEDSLEELDAIRSH